MNQILSDIDRDLDVIFGEFRDPEVVQSFVKAVRTAALSVRLKTSGVTGIICD
jgi:hypothetical protein